MKKLIYSIIITVCLVTTIACGNSSSSEATQNSENQVENIIAEEDNAKVDTTEIIRGDSEGFGRCAESRCYCKAFKGRGQTCQNCGHAYKKHY